jgi:hypothetical protein
MAGGYKGDDNVKKGSGSKPGQHDSGSVKPGGGDAGAEATEKSHNVEFAKGGDTPMFGEQDSNAQKPGGTAHDTKGTAPGPKFADGGTTKMFGYAASQPATAGITSAR